MHITLVHVHVKSAHIDDFVAATAANCTASRREPGNRRFDVLQAQDNPAQFILYEAFADATAAAAHKQTAHYLHWREQVAPWMATPRQASSYRDVGTGASGPSTPATE